jgi:hypothetical protein
MAVCPKCRQVAVTAGDINRGQYLCYEHSIARLGLSQRAAGKFLGVDERTSRRWIAGDSAPPESVAKLLRLMVRLNLSPTDVR